MRLLLPVPPEMTRDAEEPVTGQFLSPRLPKMLLGGMLPNPPTVVPVRGGVQL